MPITLDAAKQSLYSDEPLSSDELADLLSLVEVYPQPIAVLERLAREMELDIQRGARLIPAGTSNVLGEMSAAVPEAVLDIQALREEAVGEFMGRRAVENPKSYLASLKKIIGARKDEKRSGEESYLALARKLLIMDVVRVKLAAIREKYDLKCLEWGKYSDVQWASSYDLITSLTLGIEKTYVPDLQNRLIIHIQTLCEDVNLNPEDGFGVMTALLAFDVKPEDLKSSSKHMKTVLHFALQKDHTMLSRVRVTVDDAGLLAGALMALGHLDLLLARDDLPDGVKEWVDYARDIRHEFALEAGHHEDVDRAMEETGGRLSSLRISHPQVAIELSPDMTSKDIEAAWKLAKSKMMHVHAFSEEYTRKWEKWLKYDEQITLYLMFEEEKAQSKTGAIYRAMRRFDKVLIDQGEPAYYKAYDVSRVDIAKSVIRQIEKYKKLKTV